MNVVGIYPNREYYAGAEAAKNSITVGELIRRLQDFDENAKVVFVNDNGYTYGYVNADTIDEQWVRDEDEE